MHAGEVMAAHRALNLSAARLVLRAVRDDTARAVVFNRIIDQVTTDSATYLHRLFASDEFSTARDTGDFPTTPAAPAAGAQASDDDHLEDSTEQAGCRVSGDA